MTHFKEQIHAIAVAIAHLGDDLTVRHVITTLNEQFTVVAIYGNSTGTVRDDNQLTVTAHVLTDVENSTGCSGADIVSHVAGNFNTFAVFVTELTQNLSTSHRPRQTRIAQKLLRTRGRGCRARQGHTVANGLSRRGLTADRHFRGGRHRSFTRQIGHRLRAR